MKMGYDSGVAVMNALIDMYGKCKCIGDALEIFEMMQEKDLFSWNSIMTVHEQCGYHDGTLKLFDRMLHAGIQPDLVTVTTVLPACSHLAALMHGKAAFALDGDGCGFGGLEIPSTIHGFLKNDPPKE
ncbi:hypothetical protein Patl1_10150 [Pistacia atlantica]|uniref:Uncharacterized protein n=1 Tax=Pistacia atlantica TaxID=434234 RepID=A0ACC1A040_9ROSI|nr:hypothetical protein Patl1_10150 [Pistacia atlantica]